MSFDQISIFFFSYGTIKKHEHFPSCIDTCYSCSIFDWPTTKIRINKFKHVLKSKHEHFPVLAILAAFLIGRNMQLIHLFIEFPFFLDNHICIFKRAIPLCDFVVNPKRAGRWRVRRRRHRFPCKRWFFAAGRRGL